MRALELEIDAIADRVADSIEERCVQLTRTDMYKGFNHREAKAQIKAAIREAPEHPPTSPVRDDERDWRTALLEVRAEVENRRQSASHDPGGRYWQGYADGMVATRTSIDKKIAELEARSALPCTNDVGAKA